MPYTFGILEPKYWDSAFWGLPKSSQAQDTSEERTWEIPCAIYLSTLYFDSSGARFAIWSRRYQGTLWFILNFTHLLGAPKWCCINSLLCFAESSNALNLYYSVHFAKKGSQINNKLQVLYSFETGHSPSVFCRCFLCLTFFCISVGHHFLVVLKITFANWGG